MKTWLYVHRTMIAYCRYCTCRAEWALLQKESDTVSQILGFFCKVHREEFERPLMVETVREGTTE